MPQKIRDCLTIAEYAPIDFTASGWESQLLRGALLTYELGDVVQRLVERIAAPAESGGPCATLLVGAPGTGKTFVIKLLQALALHSDVPFRDGPKRLGEIHAALKGRPFSILEVTASETRTADASLALDFIARYLNYAAQAQSGGDRETTLRALEEAFQSLPPGTRALVIVDCLDDWLRTVSRRHAAAVIDALELLSEALRRLPLAVVATVTDATLDCVNRRFLTNDQVTRLLAHFSLEYLSADAIPAVIGAHLLSKNARQRHAIATVRERLLANLPELKLDEQRVINLYPLHLAVWDIGSRLRPYLNGFSFPQFALKVTERIKNRPAESLFTVDEMLDALEPTLRAAPQLKHAFEAYDRTIESVLPRISQGQRLHTRMLIKSILMHSLAGVPGTVRNLTNGILFYDLYGAKHTYALSGALLQQIKSLSRHLVASGNDPEEREYRFAINPGEVADNIIDAHARTLSDADPRINVTLAAAGGFAFEDWPIGFAGANGDTLWAIRFTHLWQVTMHDATGFIWQPTQSQATDQNGKNLLTRLHFPRRAGQADFDIEALRADEPFVHWLPGALDAEDVWTLKRLACVSDPALLGAAPFDPETQEAVADLKRQAAAIFHRKYLTEGRFVFRTGGSGETPTPEGTGPWQLWDWLPPLAGGTPPAETSDDALSPEVAEWVAHLLAPERAKVAMCVPPDLESAAAGLGAYYQAWRQNDISKAVERLSAAPQTETVIWEALRVVRQFEMTAAHVRYALTQNALTEEIEEVALLFDSDFDVFWRARQTLEQVSHYNAALKTYEVKLRYLNESFSTTNPTIERIRHGFRLREAPLWQLFYPHNRRHVDLAFGAFQPAYAEFYALLHAGATQAQVIERLCAKLVSSSEWANLELISQLAISRQDFLVDAINEISSMYQMTCTEPTEEILLTEPKCRCGFRPEDAQRLMIAEQKVTALVRRGIEIHRDILRARRNEIRERLKTRRQSVSAEVIRTIAACVNTQEMPPLNDEVIRVINEVLEE
jgi:Family of unknown function (DUF6079)